LKVCKNLEEFYKINDKDVTNILVKKFKKLLKRIPLEDLKAEIYLRLHSKNYIANFRPLEINIDEKRQQWEIKPSYAKLSTYICKFIFNYIFAYHNKVNPNDTCISLDAFDESGYGKGDNPKKILPKKKEEVVTLEESDYNLEVGAYLEDLKRRTKNKGSLVFENEKEGKILKVLDKYGEDGLDENSFFKIVVGLGDNDNGLISLIKDQVSEVTLSLEKKGFIKTKVNSGVRKIYLDDPERRSLYKLMQYYTLGWKDKEISEKFKMSVAGIGAMKRILREEIKNMRNN